MASLQSLHGGWFGWICGEAFDLGSSCAQRSLIDALNVLFLVVYILGLLISAFKRHYGYQNRIKSWDIAIVSVCCVATSIACFTAGVWALFNGHHSSIWLESLVVFIRGLVWIALAVSLNIQPKNFVGSIVPVWWASFSVLISILNTRILLQNHTLQLLDMLAWPASLLLLYTTFRWLHNNSPNNEISEPLLLEKREKNVGLQNASLFSRLTFSWLNPLLKLGYSRTLDLDDIPPLDGEDSALLAYERFSKEWDLQSMDKSRRSNRVFFALAKCYKNEMLLVGVYAMIKAISVSASPILLFGFVRYSSQEEGDLYTGMSLVGLLIVDKVVESLSQRHWFFDSRRYGMRMRSAVMAAVFQKQLKLSSIGRRKHATGEIVNYIAVDAYRLGNFPWWFHMAWSLPLQLCFSVAILLGTMGIGAVPGLVPLLVFGFLNMPFAKFLQGYQTNFMAAQDERLRATSAILNNMKVIKLQSWEENFRRMIQSLRDVEFNWLSEIQMKKAYGAALYWMSPTVVSAVIFAGTALIGSAPLDASTVFTVLATLRVMSEPVRMIPEVLTNMIQVKVSLDRIEVFLQADEITEGAVTRNYLSNSELSIRIKSGVFCWDPNLAVPTLSNINLNVSRGQKIAICGPVGAGKSSLLCAILWEMPKILGSIDVFGSIAYVSQTPWIQSGTVRDNILYGKPMLKTKYDRVIISCALDKDIENFDHGDQTEIGQRGLNMSGGQKQRIQLARAVYNDADTYLLDDPFSAVDAHTAAILFHDCVMSALANKTVILVTHQVEFLAEADTILVIENGEVTQSGTYQALLQSGTAFEQLVSAHQSSISNEFRDQTSRTSEEDQLELSTPLSTKQSSESEILIIDPSTIQLTEDEAKETGNVGWKPYKDYFQTSKGYILLGLIIFSEFVFTILQMLATYWLAVAIQMVQIGSGIVVGVYAALSILSCFFVYFRGLFGAHLGLRASKAFFSGLMDAVFKAPMLFFDSTPVGRILTRASSDMSILDFDIPYGLPFVLAGLTQAISIIAVVATVTWQVLIVAIPVMILMPYIQRYYLASARELVRINGTTKAPVMNYVGETIIGVVTIRAFAVTERFIETNLQLIDTDATLFFHTIAAMEWILLRVEALQTLTILASALFLVLLPPGTIAPGFVGLALSYALTLSSAQVFFTRWYSNMENYIISVERIKQFMHIPSEPPAIMDERRPPPSWPQEGRIDFIDLKIRYRPAAPFVLKGITCSIEAGNKVGVVGRTGSGKTTLISALFRLVEPAVGKILIDGLDICSIGLKDLRMKLSIIPQEATLFRGTVRSNLDPLGLHSDHEIWEALEKCQLKATATIRSMPALLDSSVSDDGENWSAGQRQLFCLGRVLLRKNKVLVLDEATASIDSVTDAVLQRVIRKEFSSCTVVTIAHRIPTVTDSDMVMVLSYGKLVEYDKPEKLMQEKTTYLSKLVEEYWSNCRRSSSHKNLMNL